MTNKTETFAEIAKTHLFLETLEETRTGADFREQSVWGIKAALEAAYAAGQAASAESDRALREMVAAFGTGSYGTKRQAAALKRARAITGQE